MKNLVHLKFHSTGIIHNRILDAVTELPSFPYFSIEEAHDTAVLVHDETFYLKRGELKYPEYGEVKPYYETLLKENGTSLVLQQLSKNKLVSKSFYQEAETYFKAILKVEREEEIEKLAAHFLQAVASNKKINESEQQLAEAMASVTLFSAKYWFEAIYNPLNPWYPSFEDEEPRNLKKKDKPKNKFWRAVLRIAVDVVGVLAGGAIGGMVGAAAAGATVVGGAASAAVAGK